MKFTLKIKKNKQFKYILKNSEYAKGKYLVVHIIKNENKKYSDKNFLGICISKKNGNSVMRNKMKRWVREVYKNEEYSLKKGYQIVIIYKKKSLFEYLDYQKVKIDIIKGFKELKLYE